MTRKIRGKFAVKQIKTELTLQEEIVLAKAREWVEVHRSLPYADYDCRGSYPDLPFARVSFDFDDHTAYAVRGNPDASDDNFEPSLREDRDSSVRLTWEQAVEIVGAEPAADRKDHIALIW